MFLYQKKLMDGSNKKKRSAAAGLTNGQLAGGRLHVTQQLLQLGERFAIEMVVHPAAFLAVVHEPGVLEDLQMERKARLRRVQQIGEIADTLLTAPEPLHDCQARFVGERVKQLHGSREVGFACGGGCHGYDYINSF